MMSTLELLTTLHYKNFDWLKRYKKEDRNESSLELKYIAY